MSNYLQYRRYMHYTLLINCIMNEWYYCELLIADVLLHSNITVINYAKL